MVRLWAMKWSLVRILQIPQISCSAMNLREQLNLNWTRDKQMQLIHGLNPSNRLLIGCAIQLILLKKENISQIHPSPTLKVTSSRCIGQFSPEFAESNESPVSTQKPRPFPPKFQLKNKWRLQWMKFCWRNYLKIEFNYTLSSWLH